MSASTFAWVVPLSLSTVAAAFLLLRLNRIGSWWWAPMFALGAAAFASSILPARDGAVAKLLLEDTLFVGAFLCFAGGIAGRGSRRARWAVLLGVAVLSLLAAAVAVAVFASVRAELLAVQLGIVAILAEIVRMIRNDLRHAPDRTILGLVVLAAIILLAQSVALVAIPDPSLTIASWNSSIWALVLQASGATIGVLMAAAISLLIGRDIVDDLRKAAESDPLTGALNRRGFADRSTRLEKARVKGEDLSLVVIDIDHFKRINDRFGHWAGDGVLCTMTRLLITLSGPQAAVARLGGEEFAVLLPHRSLGEARQLAESIRSAFATMHWPDPIGAEKITASFGVTDFGPGETLLMAAERADRLLYVAKNHGRDQVCFCSSESTILPPDPSGIGRNGQIRRLGSGSRAA